MGKTSQKEKRLAGRVSLALAAGMFSIVPTAYGMPSGATVTHGNAIVNDPINDPTFNDGVHKLMNITNGSDKNVIHWKDFSIAEKEHVHFDNNDYMNVVTGKATSAIDGIMDGGKNVYVINPNGVIFGANAQVNVGNLYVSTRKWATDEQLEAMETAFTNGSTVNTVLTTLTGAPTAEVVSLIDKNGYVAATEVVLEGNNIRFLNANALAKQDAENVRVVNDALSSTVTSENLPSSVAYDSTTGVFSVSSHPEAANVTFRANALETDRTKDNYGDGYIHVGNGRTTNTTKNYSPTNANNYTARYLDDLARDGGESKGVVNYSLVRTTADLQAIGNNTNTLADNYMLADHIDGSLMTKSIGLASASGNPSSPKGVNYYTGHFDGMYYTVYGLKSNGLSGTGSSIQYGNDSQVYMGLFTQTNGATIENVGVVNATITTRYGGGVVGYAKSTTLRNVWTEGGTIGHTYQDYVGGIVGYAVGTDADHPTQMVNVYNTGTVKGGGLVGYLAAYSGIRNAYNIGTLTPLSDNKTSGVVSNIDGTTTGITLANVFSASKYAVGADATKEYLSANKGKNNLGTGVTQSNVTVIHDAGELNTWITNAKKTSGTDAGNTTVSSEGGTNDTWRVYEGYSKSLPLLNSFMKAKGTVSTEYTYGETQVDTFNYNSDNVPYKTYDAKTVLGDTPVYSYLGANVAQDTDLIKQNNRKNVYTDTSGNAAKFALFYNGQQGYDLYGNNFRIDKKEVSFTDQPDLVFNKVYDGTADAKQALQDALFSADTGSGFLGADKEHLSLVVGAGITATYDDQNAGNNKDVTVSGVNSSTLTFNAKDPSSAEDLEIKNNYIFREDTLSNLNGIYTEAGTIEKRAILVGLYKTAGITKVYDGTADVYAGTEVDNIDVSGKDNVYANVDLSGLEGDANKTVREAMLLADFDDATNTSVTISSAQAKFIDDDGYDTSHVSDTTDQAKYHVAYTGITLANATLNNNYKIVAEDGVAHSDNDTSVLLAKGNITPRTVSTSDLVVEKTDGSPVTFNRTYNHLDYDTIDGAEYQAGFGTNTTTEANARNAGNLNKIIDTDANKLIITPGNKATYVDASGNPTKNATNYNGEGSGAKKVQFNVTMGLQQNADARVLSDYQWDTGEAFTDGGDPILAGGMTGTITPLDVTANIKYVTKEYNGLATIEGAESEITEGMLYTTGDNADDVTISVSNAAFQEGGGYGGADVAYVNSDSDEVADKSIQYTLAISGADAGNYRLTAAGAAATGGKTGTVSNRGRITPKEVTFAFGEPEKVYNESYAVEGASTENPNNKITLTITGLVSEGDFDKSQVIGRYGTKEGDTFTPDAEVGDKIVAYTTGTQENPASIYDAFTGNKKKNYKIKYQLGETIHSTTWKSSNTVYGKGKITEAHIDSSTIANLLDYNNKYIGLEMTYYGSATYDKSQGGNKTLNGTGADGLRAADVIQADSTATTGIAAALQKIFGEGSGLTIAEAVYANENAVTFDGTEGKDVGLKFKFKANVLSNYSFDNVDDSGYVSFTKGGYTGKINKRDLTVTYNGPTSFEKTYDGTTTLKADGVAFSSDDIKGWFPNSSLTGIVKVASGGVRDDDVYIKNGITAEYSDKNASSTATQDVYFRNIVLDGAQAANYNLKFNGATVVEKTVAGQKVNAIEGIGTINARSVQIKSVSDMDRTFALDANGDAYAGTDAGNLTVGITLKDTSGLEDDLILNDKLLTDDGKGQKVIALAKGDGTYGEGYGSSFVANPHVKKESGELKKRNVQYTSDVLEAVRNFIEDSGNYVLEANGDGKDFVKAGDSHLYGKGTINPAAIDLTNVTVKADTTGKVTTLDHAYVFRKEYDKLNDITVTRSDTSKDADDAYTKLNNFNWDEWKSLLKVEAEFKDEGGTEYVNSDVQPIAVKISLKSGVGDNSDDFTITGAAADGTKTIYGYGEIYARKLYAYLAKPEETASYMPLTKTYDGTATVKDENVNTWVKLKNGDHIIIAGDDVVIDKANITAAYVGEGTEAAADANETSKKVQFSNIGLLNNANKNYELIVLNDGETAETATNAAVKGNDKTGTLTTAGKILKRTINLKDFQDAADRFYNGSADVIIGTWTPSLEMDLTDLGDDGDVFMTNYGTNDLGKLGIKEGSLKGVYGEWHPTAEDGTLQFWVNPHVKKDDPSTTNVNEAEKPVLYYGMELENTTGSDVLKNYKLGGNGKVAIKSEDGTTSYNPNLATTVYFEEAKKKGVLKPLAISTAALEEQWNGAPLEKVYDGTAWITSHGNYTAYDVDGNPLTDDVDKYLTIYYNANNDSTVPVEDRAKIGKVKLAYDPSKAIAKYDDVNAGSDKKFTYSGLDFSGLNSNDFEDFEVVTADLNQYYVDHADKLISPDENRGSIARRLLVVDADYTPLVNGDNAKTYDGSKWLIETPEKYTADLWDSQNQAATGLVGNDDVSITYVANFDNANANVDSRAEVPAGDWDRNVTYTFTLADKPNEETDDPDDYYDFAKNYTLVQGQDTRKGAIRKREVYVEFADGEGEGYDKTYDKSSSLFDNNGTSVLDSGKTKNQILLAHEVANGSTGIVGGEWNENNRLEGVHFDYDGVTANYVDATGNADAGADAALGITARKVYFQNMNVVNADGTVNTNYVVKAKNGNAYGNSLPSATDPDTTMETLVGFGSVKQRTIDVALNGTPTKVYDGNKKIMDVNGADYEARKQLAPDSGKYIGAGEHITIAADGVTDGLATANANLGITAGSDTTVGADTIADIKISVDSALYSDPNAANGIGVTYTLKWNNKNYELVHHPLDQGNNEKRIIEGTGNITPRPLDFNPNATLNVNKPYDTTSAVVADVSYVTDGLFISAGDADPDRGLLAGEDVRFNYTSEGYKDALGNLVSDTGAAADSTNGAQRAVQLNFTIGNSNYMLDVQSANGNGNIARTGDNTGTYTGTGRINRAQLTLTPNNVTYTEGDTIPTNDYVGAVTGFKGNDVLADSYNVTFGRDDNRSTAVGNYTLLGYVNGQLPTHENGLMYYNDLGNTGNYYFVQQPNTNLHIVQNPQETAVTDAVQDAVIADKKFTPDDYSYNRMSKDQDLTRVNRQSSAAVQYAEKGVNLDGDGTKSGLSALADIRGAGSVVNLNGALIQTSAPAEQPEKVAEAAALPMSETSENGALTPLPEQGENDVSSIGLEYADNTSGSQSVLEILTNASNNAEKKGTSIVIDTQDEDEEDAEEEKSRRAIFADRSNIGIETLGDAVNLNQMIG